jgi:uncharacterized protein with FMN-binding domain
MKRALLIAGGTVGGLGAVLAITPPQLGSQGAMGGLSNIASAAATTAAPVAQTTTTTPVASTPVATTPTANTSAATATTAKATSVKKKKVTKTRVAVARATHKTTTPVATTPTAAATTPVATTPTPVKSTPPAPAPATKKVSGTFTGNVVNVNYGNVQVQITVVDGKITDAQALQAPSGRSDRYTQYALPILRSQTLAAQGSNIQGASGASYTSYGWYTSLQAALAKAGL